MIFPSIKIFNSRRAKLGVYYSLAVRRILPYVGCGIRFLQDIQCGKRFFGCNAVAEKWNSNERLAIFRELLGGEWFVPCLVHCFLRDKKRHYPSKLPITVKVWSSKLVDSHKFP